MGLDEDREKAILGRHEAKRRAKAYISFANGYDLGKTSEIMDITGEEVLSKWSDLLLEGLEPKCSGSIDSHKRPEKHWAEVELWEED